ncbi:Aspartic peptidase [Artemisia annua]|uniref:Aspartic peptidase n=1 Tax=Artemisia annua TaxID=35608 RepID=A0A2U1MQE3_ARTAN|nr:Aspartic peptidase [Artemisia annua]
MSVVGVSLFSQVRRANYHVCIHVGCICFLRKKLGCQGTYGLSSVRAAHILAGQYYNVLAAIVCCPFCYPAPFVTRSIKDPNANVMECYLLAIPTAGLLATVTYLTEPQVKLGASNCDHCLKLHVYTKFANRFLRFNCWPVANHYSTMRFLSIMLITKLVLLATFFTYTFWWQTPVIDELVNHRDCVGLHIADNSCLHYPTVVTFKQFPWIAKVDLLLRSDVCVSVTGPDSYELSTSEGAFSFEVLSVVTFKQFPWIAKVDLLLRSDVCVSVTGPDSYELSTSEGISESTHNNHTKSRMSTQQPCLKGENSQSLKPATAYAFSLFASRNSGREILWMDAYYVLQILAVGRFYSNCAQNQVSRWLLLFPGCSTFFNFNLFVFVCGLFFSCSSRSKMRGFWPSDGCSIAVIVCGLRSVSQKFLDAIKTMVTTLKTPDVWRPCLYMYLSLALGVSIHEGMFYWYTDAKSGPSFSQTLIPNAPILKLCAQVLRVAKRAPAPTPTKKELLQPIRKEIENSRDANDMKRFRCYNQLENGLMFMNTAVMLPILYLIYTFYTGRISLLIWLVALSFMVMYVGERRCAKAMNLLHKKRHSKTTKSNTTDSKTFFTLAYAKTPPQRAGSHPRFTHQDSFQLLHLEVCRISLLSWLVALSFMVMYVGDRGCAKAMNLLHKKRHSKTTKSNTTDSKTFFTLAYAKTPPQRAGSHPRFTHQQTIEADTCERLQILVTDWCNTLCQFYDCDLLLILISDFRLNECGVFEKRGYVFAKLASVVNSSLQVVLELTLYNPEDSITRKNITCDQDFCAEINGGVVTACKANESCLYSATYTDGSYSFGYLVEDVVQFDSVSGDLETKKASGSVIFGCGTSQSGNLGSSKDALDGIFGFGKSKSSIISQLSSSRKVKNMFAHCLYGDNGGGIFAIGHVVQPKVNSIPLIPDE